MGVPVLIVVLVVFAVFLTILLLVVLVKPVNHIGDVCKTESVVVERGRTRSSEGAFRMQVCCVLS